VSDIVTIGLIQAHHDTPGGEPVAVHKRVATEKHVRLIREAAGRGAKIVCLQELFYGPYFCTEQDPKWYEATELVPDGPTTRSMQDLARELGIALVVPLYERTISGVYYNTAVVIDADGTVLGIYRKHHIPQVAAGPAGCGFWEKYYFKPGNAGYHTFQTKFARIGAYICYDRHFPEGARLLGLNGAEIVFNPSATVAGLSQYLWKLEQPAHAVANGYFVAASNRVGTEAPWNIGKFYGTSYIVDPRGSFIATASEDKDELIMGACDLDQIEETRKTWQFYRDRRPETYGDMTRLM
jgi:beta-ureidopropionase